MDIKDVIVVGAGPAGLTAAYELAKRGIRAVVLEQSDRVGGLARTETHKGFRFDIGGHRFFSKNDRVKRLWEEMLGADFIRVRRLSRIYYRGRFFAYPLDPFNVLSNVGLIEVMRFLKSYLQAKWRPCPQEENFEQWVVNRFGRRLYERFFKSYTEKVWGIPCQLIRSDWAAQRIRGLSLKAVLIDVVFGTSSAKTLIHKFRYPSQGPGMMWACFRQAVERCGGAVHLRAEVIRLHREGRAIKRITVRENEETFEKPVDCCISTMPLAELVARLDPPPPEPVLLASRQLRYRAFILAGLILNRADVFPDNWIYIHDPDVHVGRIQNFKNWSAEMVPDSRKTGLGMEYFCSTSIEDPIWALPDARIVQLAIRELDQLGLARPGDVEGGFVIREPKAYPVYDLDYRRHLQVIREFLGTIDNLYTIGRGGMHRYNNQDHSMLTAMACVENLLGPKRDLWEVNTERTYQEEFVAKT